MVTGFGVNVGMNALALAGVAKWPVIADPILVGVICSYLAVSAVSRGGSVSKAESDYRTALHAMPPQERDEKVVRQTLVWPKVMVAMGCVIAALLTVFYALPYQQAVAAGTGMLREVM